jgi:hypothetical protein
VLTTHRIAIAGQIVTTRLVASQGGDLAVAAPVILAHHTTPTELVLAVKRPAGEFGPAIVVSATGASVTAYDLVIDPHGDVLVTWQRGSSLYARWRRATGSMTATQRLGASQSQPLLTSAASTSLRGVVLWQSQAVDYANNPKTAESANIVRAAVASTDGRFQASRTIDSYPDRLPVLAGCNALTSTNPPLSASIDANGNGLLAWTGRTGGHFAVRYAALSSSGAATAATIAVPGIDLCLGGAATPGAAASTLLAYAPGSEANPAPVIAATQTTPGGPFSATQQIGVDEGPAELALDPANDTLVAIWQQDPNTLGYAETAG